MLMQNEMRGTSELQKSDSSAYWQLKQLSTVVEYNAFIDQLKEGTFKAHVVRFWSYEL